MNRSAGRRASIVAVALAVAVAASACSKPKSAGQALRSSQLTTPSLPEELGQEASTVPTGPAASTAATAAAAATPGAAKPGAAAAPGAKGAKPAGGQNGTTGVGDNSQAQKIGALIKPQTTARRQPYWNGITDNAINLDFSYDKTSCGVNVVNAITAAGGALPTQTRYYRSAPTTQDQVVADNEESIKIMVDYWNKHAFDQAASLPTSRPLMGNDPNNQFFGRHLTYKTVDGGSNQCPDKTTAAARQATDADHAFMVFNNFDGAGYNMAADLNALPGDRRPMHFGSLWLSDSDYSRFAPYSWTQFSTGTTIMSQLASYVCARLVGQKASRSPDAAIAAQTRKFGLVHTDLPQDKKLVSEFKAYLQSFGCNIPFTEVEYNGTDFGQAQRDNQNLVLQLKLANVTSVVMIADPVQPLFQLQTAAGQKYFPEWIWSSFGYDDSSTVQRLYDQTETAGSFGTSNLGVPGGFGFGAGDPFAMYHDSHKVSPKDGQPCDPSSDAGMSHDSAYCKAPTALVTWYYTMLPAVGGLIYAGPDPTPQTVSGGLQAFPPTHYGGNGPTSDPRPALVGAGKDKYGFIVDAVEWRWRPDFTSPAPESKAHWVEYPDCQRHYFSWVGPRLASGWEPNGPNYGAWCGDKNGYPRTLPDDGNH